MRNGVRHRGNALAGVMEQDLVSSGQFDGEAVGIFCLLVELDVADVRSSFIIFTIYQSSYRS